jgi:hypothetical protein
MLYFSLHAINLHSPQPTLIPRFIHLLQVNKITHRTDEGTHHIPPLLSVLPFDCVQKCLIKGPQHSSVYSFVSAHDLM